MISSILFRGMAIFKLKTSHLPLLACIWVSPTTLIAAGHDCTPLVFQVEPSGQVLSSIQFILDQNACITMTRVLQPP